MTNAKKTTLTGPDQPAETLSPAPLDESADSQPGLFGKIGNAVADVASRHGLSFKRGRGRPRKDGSPKANDTLVNTASGQSVPAADNPALAAAVQPPAPATDFILHRTIIGAFKGLLKALGKYVKKLAGDAEMSREWIDRNMAACEPDPEALADWSESAKVVMEKYNVRSEYSPEIALVVNTGRLVAPYGVMIIELRKEIALRRAEREAGHGQAN